MLAGGNGGVILNFVSVGRLQQIPLIISTTCESTAHVYSRSGVEDSFGATGANILKAGFINGAFVKLIVDARRQVGAGTRIGNSVRELNRVKICIECRSAYDGNFVQVAAVEIEKERSFLADWTADVAAIQNGMIAGLDGIAFERVARVKRGIVAINQ